ncbi:MAG: ATP synthase F0 subunit B [Syntrophobacterales bacterium]|nr:ATP synthase F0 subunit B [Syntrophobacterales bacterium]
MVELNFTVWIQTVNFIVLIFVLNFLLYKPVLKIIEKRNKKIEESDEKVKALNETIEHNMAEYESKIRQAKVEATVQKNEIEEEGAEQGKTIIGKVRDEISEKLGDFKTKLQGETDKARGVLRDQTRTIATEISEKILGRDI